MRLFFSKIFLSAIQLPTAQCLTTTTFKKTKSIPSYPTSSHFFPLFSNPSKSKIKYQITDIEPEDVGIESQTLKGLIIDSPAQSLALIREALANNPNKTPIAKKAADMIALNAGATIYVAGKADTIKQGVAIAQDIISSGKALQKMAALASFTQQLTSH